MAHIVAVVHARAHMVTLSTQGAHHLVEEQTHKHKQRPQHKGLSQQQPPRDRRTMMIGFPHIQ